jgi:hypothetical protein
MDGGRRTKDGWRPKAEGRGMDEGLRPKDAGFRTRDGQGMDKGWMKDGRRPKAKGWTRDGRRMDEGLRPRDSYPDEVRNSQG